jgi:serine phosphatase RsbU (regulator of sigma subunit)/anti-sigma regulatory factor (Ser/Thr protein kinase)
MRINRKNRISYLNAWLLAHNWREHSVHNLQESPVTPGKRVSRKGPPANANANPSVRTLILGIDRSGMIVQHDRTAPLILARDSDDLLGVHLSEITTEAQQARLDSAASDRSAVDGADGSALDGDHGRAPLRSRLRTAARDSISQLLEAVKNEREARAMLTIVTAADPASEAVVTVRPMHGIAGDTSLAALATLQLPAPSNERFVDPGVMRTLLLQDTFQDIDSTQDFAELASRLMDKLVPHFCTAGDLLVLESLVGDDEFPTYSPDGGHPLRRLAVKHNQNDPAWTAAFPSGEILRYPAGSPYVRCIESGEPVLESLITIDEARKLSKAWRRKPVAKLLSGVSMLILPLIARGTTLGFVVCTREQGTHRFSPYDMDIGAQFAARAAVFIDAARQYNREHATALTLQRSMLPRDLTYPSSVEVKHRYLPGSELVEVGGDWYESISLPGARVALVIGDVAGHGVRAAVTMGRLRTAIQTLAMLELPPAESLQQLDELMDRMLGRAEPHFATCAYAVYDAVTGELEISSAGHLPPLLVRPDGSNELVHVPECPPLGVGLADELPGECYETLRLQVEDGSLLVLYTDGLVEDREKDIQEGLDWLKGTFGPGSPQQPLEDLCKLSLREVYEAHQRDDIAVLIARLRRIPEDNRMVWQLAPEETSVRQARMLIRDPMKRWGLEDYIPVTELLVSELVTNAIRYGSKGEFSDGADIEFRLILEGGLICEVSDPSPALPRVLQVDRDAENGRGLHVVSQLSSRWGSRRTRTGKVVWCEQKVPAAVLEAADAVPVMAEVNSPLSILDPVEVDLEATGPMPILELEDTGPMPAIPLSLYSTVTLLARLRGLSMSRPSLAAAW